MDGDTGVILPKGLHHPKHWPGWENETIDSNFETNSEDSIRTNSSSLSPPTVNFKTQTSFLIRAAALAGQIEFAVTEFRKTNSGNEIPDEVILFESLANVFRNMASTVTDDRHSNARIEALENQITDLKQIIEDLIKASATSPAKPLKTQMTEKFLLSIAGTTGAALVGGTGFFLGVNGVELLNPLSQLLGLSQTPATNIAGQAGQILGKSGKAP